MVAHIAKMEENFSEHKDNNVGTRRNRTFRDDMGEQ